MLTKLSLGRCARHRSRSIKRTASATTTTPLPCRDIQMQVHYSLFQYHANKCNRTSATDTLCRPLLPQISTTTTSLTTPVPRPRRRPTRILRRRHPTHTCPLSPRTRTPQRPLRSSSSTRPTLRRRATRRTRNPTPPRPQTRLTAPRARRTRSPQATRTPTRTRTRALARPRRTLSRRSTPGIRIRARQVDMRRIRVRRQVRR
jgi:hypothetical protein